MVKLVVLIILIMAAVLIFSQRFNTNQLISPLILEEPVEQIQKLLPSPSPKVNLQTPPQSKVLPNNYHIFQTFNNCGPAALSMALSYFGINVSQKQLGQDLRPYQISGGDNDDKSVTLEELAEKSKEYELIPYHRPNGNIELIKLFIIYDIPVIARTLTKPHEDIGHYRIVKGYDDNRGQIIQDDSLQNKNLWFNYDDFNTLWEKFNFEYLVLVPEDKKEIAEAILGQDLDPEN
ncbi:C39 family peptidase, partial [Candidatus Daviesbacteria bacterium]|nr:C39 family peptidase [Candidatus Daviesbacteria bacterium]